MDPSLKALPVQYRSFQIKVTKRGKCACGTECKGACPCEGDCSSECGCSCNTESREAEPLSVEIALSSEEPYQRWWGNEVLDHSASSIVRTRMDQPNGIALLFNHDTDQLLGRLTNFKLGKDRILRALATFSQDPEAQRRAAQVREGMLCDASIGYQIHEITTENPDTPNEVQRVTGWEPLEGSLVTVPADATVGIGRAAGVAGDEELFPVRIVRAAGEVPPTPAQRAATQEDPMDPVTPTPAASTSAGAPAPVNVQEIRNLERTQALQLRAIGAKHGLAKETDELLNSTRSMEEIREAFFGILEKTQAQPVPAPASTSQELGLSDKDKDRFSIGRAVMAVITGDYTKAGFEREVSQAMAGRMGRATSGLFVPSDFQIRSANTLNTQTVGKGKEAVFAEYAGFIDVLRNRTKVMQMGARFYGGLRSNYSFVRKSATATMYWVSENPGVDVTETTLGFQNVTATPKTLKGNLSFTAQQLAQAEEAFDALVQDELVAVHAIEWDRVAINGSGAAGQPLGILGTAGIGAVALGTNGLAIPSISPLVDLESQITTQNADLGKLGYLTNAYQRGVLKKTQEFGTGTAVKIWQENGKNDGGGIVNGYQAYASNNVPGNLTKGTSNGICSALIFGNWDELMVMEWNGGLELVIDPYTLAGQDITRVISRQLLDIQLRHPASFAAIKDAL